MLNTLIVIRYIKTKIKSYEYKINKKFQGKTILKEKASFKYLSLIMLDFVIRVTKKYYPQTHLVECKNEIKNNKMENLINEDLDQSSPDNKIYSGSDNQVDDENDNDSNE